MINQVLDFWFKEIEPACWWRKDLRFDDLVSKRFLSIHQQASAAELYSWRQSNAGRLAEIIVLDQFSRNIYRDTAQAFACDSVALVLAQEAVAAGSHKALPAEQVNFLLMPYMHSESLDMHGVAESLYKSYGTEASYQFERKHKAIIDRFGRYPHRNAILQRESTQEEKAFLEQPGSSF